MMKMLIQIDENKIIEDGKYDLSEIWKFIDSNFLDTCNKEKCLDGSVIYIGKKNADYYTAMNLALMLLEDSKPFAKYCIKWIWYENDDDSSNFDEIDVLSRQKMDNPLFR